MQKNSLYDIYDEPESIQDRLETSSNKECCCEPNNFDWFQTNFDIETPPEIFTETPDPIEEVSRMANEGLSYELIEPIILPDPINATILDNNDLIIDKAPRKNKKKERIPNESKRILIQWIKNHIENPYANSEELNKLCLKTNMTPRRIRTFLTNYRIRHLKKSEDEDEFFFEKKTIPIRVEEVLKIVHAYNSRPTI